MILETKRLYLRRFILNDAKDMYLLNLDEEVLKFTGDNPFLSIGAATNFIKKYNHYDRYDFGRWAVITKEENHFIGWCGLKYTSELDEVDIGFRFFKKYWNQGFATESAIACLDYGFKKHKLKLIVGRAMKENIYSIKVLEKIGMSFIKEINFDGKLGLKFVSYNPMI